MKALKIVGVLIAVYVLVVVGFESLLGYFQPQSQTTHVITTRDSDGEYPRVLARIEMDGKLYAAVNHWPRAWYYRALENPQVSITFEDATRDYLAVLVDGAEHDAVDQHRPLGPVFRILTGFPPRYILRLDPA